MTKTAYDTCPHCNGSGLQLADYTAEPTWCRECDGDGVVRARDARGRFTLLKRGELARSSDVRDPE